MLWSDPRDEPPKELLATQAMFRRLSWLLPLIVLGFVVLLHAH
ncbi:MAG: morphogenic membrane protein MmpB [Streptomyces sp.]